MSRRLKGGIPRGMLDHRSSEGKLYGEDCRAILERFPVGKAGRHWVKEHGRIIVDLDRVGKALDKALTRSTSQALDIRRLKREQRLLRAHLFAIERQLQDLAGSQLQRPMNTIPTIEELMADANGSERR